MTMTCPSPWPRSARDTELEIPVRIEASCVHPALDVLRLSRRQILRRALAVTALLLHGVPPPETRCRSPRRIRDARREGEEIGAFCEVAMREPGRHASPRQGTVPDAQGRRAAPRCLRARSAR